MTVDEARKVAAIAASADGGCASCVTALFEKLQAVFPEFRWSLTDQAERETQYDADEVPARIHRWRPQKVRAP